MESTQNLLVFTDQQQPIVTSVDFSFTPVDFSEWSYNQLVDHYHTRGRGCRTGFLGKNYSFRNDTLLDQPCLKWHCPLCRPYLKQRLYEKTLQQIEKHKLYYHVIITFGGRAERDRVGYFGSFKLFNRRWNVLRTMIKREFPDFEYIVFPRAHTDKKGKSVDKKNVGICHYHLLTNIELNGKWLTALSQKCHLGFTLVCPNENAVKYLYRDYYVDDEWFIPLNVRHYRCSRAIKLNDIERLPSDLCSIHFGPRASLVAMEKAVELKFGRVLPFSYYLTLWALIDSTKLPVIPGLYINGVLKKPLIIERRCSRWR